MPYVSEKVTLPKTKIVAHAGSDNAGGYGVRIGDDSMIWFSCREQLHQMFDFTLDLEFFFRYTVIGVPTVQELSDFVNAVEAKIGVEPSVFRDCDVDHFCHVKFSRWWRDDIIRLHFYTVLLRCLVTKSSTGWRWSGNYKDVIFAHTYFDKTATAVNYFLDGRTSYSGRSRAWYSVMTVAPHSLVKADREERIKKMAYNLWLIAGKPEGRSDEFYYQASKEIDALTQGA